MQKITELDHDLAVIIAAGGSGSRFSAENSTDLRSKLFVSCGSLPEFATGPVTAANFAAMPLFMLSVINFTEFCPDHSLIIVVREEEHEEFSAYLKKYLPDRHPVLVSGGQTRMHSVRNGLKALTSSPKFVAVHDAARPFASKKLIAACLEAAEKHGSAVAARRMTDTVKEFDEQNLVTRTLDRASLCAVETPQIFVLNKLRAAYEKALADGIMATDDAGVMEYAGYRPYLFLHTENNRKITYHI